ncbi:hypothetical protein LY78DRAFT_654052 [Colletotrichum sublineola]|nr:hypothetical protein LY78DRAFT_654052 [Colletotrichum sublineola]
MSFSRFESRLERKKGRGAHLNKRRRTCPPLLGALCTSLDTMYWEIGSCTQQRDLPPIRPWGRLNCRIIAAWVPGG